LPLLHPPDICETDETVKIKGEKTTVEFAIPPIPSQLMIGLEYDTTPRRFIILPEPLSETPFIYLKTENTSPLKTYRNSFRKHGVSGENMRRYQR
jgi:hypothetical protein